jgi:RimJ/RimL family protein N-acetyltransferase
MKFDNFGDIFIRKIVLDQDVPLIHDWFSREYASFRGMQGKSFQEVRDKYQRMLEGEEYDLAVGVLPSSGDIIFLIECYRPEKVSIAKYYDAREGDRGFHIIVAPPERPISGLTFYVMLAICEYIFQDPLAHRIVAEPDIRNEKVLIRFVQAGYKLDQVVQLPSKTAQMVSITRDKFLAMDRGIKPKKKHLRFWKVKLKYHLVLGRAYSKFAKINYKRD